MCSVSWLFWLCCQYLPAGWYLQVNSVRGARSSGRSTSAQNRPFSVMPLNSVTRTCPPPPLVKTSLLAKWLARKWGSLSRIVSTKPRPKIAYYDVFSLVYCFIVLLCVCLVSRPDKIYFILLWHDMHCAKNAVKHQSTNQPTSMILTTR